MSKYFKFHQFTMPNNLYTTPDCKITNHNVRLDMKQISWLRSCLERLRSKMCSTHYVAILQSVNPIDSSLNLLDVKFSLERFFSLKSPGCTSYCSFYHILCSGNFSLVWIIWCVNRLLVWVKLSPNSVPKQGFSAVWIFLTFSTLHPPWLRICPTKL